MEDTMVLKEQKQAMVRCNYYYIRNQFCLKGNIKR